jgi:sugar O-acyltransferase (sialic acid O-acetyltransferase NeuD family)
VDPTATSMTGIFCGTHENGVQPGNSPTLGNENSRVGRFDPPQDCHRILIVGAGGFGREVLQWAREAWPDQASLIAGFLSDDPLRLESYSTGVGILAAVHEYRPANGDYLLLGIGVPYARRRVAESLQSCGSRFLRLVHPGATVAASAVVGEGSIVCPYAVVSDSAQLGRHVLVNYHASLGHDSVAGDYAVLSPYAALGGAARVDEEVFLGLHASVGPGKIVGARSKISANSCVLAAAPADSIIFGVPGRVSPRISVSSS